MTYVVCFKDTELMISLAKTSFFYYTHYICQKTNVWNSFETTFRKMNPLCFKVDDKQISAEYAVKTNK